jgi:ADP-heptose:LPS heptosyltransferase
MRGLIRFGIILLAIIQSFFFWKIKKRTPKKILIAHDLLLGDTLLLTPLMKRIHENYPFAEKFILSKPLFVPLFKNEPYGFKALAFNPKSILSIWKISSHAPYDLTFVAGDNRYSWLARAMGSKWIVGIADDTPKWKNWMLDEAKFFDSKPATWADMMGRLLDGKDPEPYIKNEWSQSEIKKSSSSSFDTSRPYVVCHLGASSKLKLWPQESWQALIIKLKKQNYQVVLSVGPKEEYLIKEVDPKHECRHVLGTYSLTEMWSLIEDAKLLISVDTGIAHIAKLTSTPILTLFGPGSSVSHGVGNFWRLHPHADVTDSYFPCRDQGILFRRKVNWVKRCGRGIDECRTPGACMEAIGPKEVLNALLKSDLF